MIICVDGNTIEAVQWTGSNLDRLKRFVGTDLEYAIRDTDSLGDTRATIDIYLDTNAGRTFVDMNSYIIKRDTSFEVVPKDEFTLIYNRGRIINDDDSRNQISN